MGADRQKEKERSREGKWANAGPEQISKKGQQREE
jgi:hypothetical protein